MSSPPTITVTGAGGFIGRHVVRALLQRNASVIAVDRDASALSHVPEDASRIQADLNDAAWHEPSALGDPDALIHLAWAGLPNYRSLHHFEDELPRQFRLLGNLVRRGLRRLVVTGTCFEYGMQSGPLHEQLTPAPANPYALAKDSLRRQLQFLCEICPFEFTWARLFYMHGEGQASSSILPQLEVAIRSGAETFDMSGGEQLRDYLPVTDVAGMLAELALRPHGVGIVNICSGRPISVRSLVEGWARERNSSIRVNLGARPYPDWEPFAFWGCAGRIKEILGQ